MSSASGMCQAYPVYTSGAPEDVSTALHGSGEGSLCTKVHAAPASPLYGQLRRAPMQQTASVFPEGKPYRRGIPAVDNTAR